MTYGPRSKWTCYCDKGDQHTFQTIQQDPTPPVRRVSTMIPRETRHWSTSRDEIIALWLGIGVDLHRDLSDLYVFC